MLFLISAWQRGEGGGEYNIKSQDGYPQQHPNSENLAILVRLDDKILSHGKATHIGTRRLSKDALSGGSSGEKE